ncbi:hypothetical protein [Phenylobacterium sp.]|uniref:hypothetical protein n=1 Tax=Phenylobacterium sp. TaxID=1871053 RepID=UPI003D274A85
MEIVASGLALGLVAAFLWGRRPALGIVLWLPAIVFAVLVALSLAADLRDGLLLGSLLVSAGICLLMLVSGCGGVAAGLLLRFVLRIPMSGSIWKLYFPARR